MSQTQAANFPGTTEKKNTYKSTAENQHKPEDIQRTVAYISNFSSIKMCEHLQLSDEN